MTILDETDVMNPEPYLIRALWNRPSRARSDGMTFTG